MEYRILDKTENPDGTVKLRVNIVIDGEGLTQEGMIEDGESIEKAVERLAALGVIELERIQANRPVSEPVVTKGEDIKFNAKKIDVSTRKEQIKVEIAEAAAAEEAGEIATAEAAAEVGEIAKV